MTGRIVTGRLANHLTEIIEVSDRSFLKPLLRATTVPQRAFVPALTKAEVRWGDVTAKNEDVETRALDAGTRGVIDAIAGGVLARGGFRPLA